MRVMNHPFEGVPCPGEVPVFALLVLGIDNLQTLEELFGEQLGEEIWEKITNRLRPLVPRIATLKQTGHRRLAVGLPGYDPPGVAALVEDLQTAAASAAIETAQGPIACTISAGCAFMASHDKSASMDALTSAALHALHDAMRRGVGTFQVATDDTELLHHRDTLMSASRAALGAIESDHLRIAFQPIVSAKGGNTVSFHECLVRILQPSGKLISASAFMPAIERLGMATLIDRQVLMMSFEAMTLEPRARLSVNLFPQTMQDGAWLRMFEDAVAADPTLGERLIIEVTERAAMLDATRTLRFMDRLREHGVGFALDDFGAGQTSLRYLRDFRFDALKIDGQFIRAVHEDADCAFFVEKIVEIAHRFDMMTIAEHVHGPASAHLLMTLGVEYFQGFHFGAPNMVLQPTGSPITDLAQQA